MNLDEAREILSACRIEDAEDPLFTPALAFARREPELARWLAAERARDALLRRHLQAVPVPRMLRAALFDQLRAVRRL